MLLTLCYFLLACAEPSTNTSADNTASTEVNQSERNPISEQICSIFQDSKGNYWFGSNGEGVYVYNGTSLRDHTTTNGLVNNTIRGFQEDATGNIYVETPQGVSQFDGLLFSTLPVNKSGSNDWKLEPGDLWFSCNGDASHVYRSDGEQLYQLKLPKQDLASALGIYEGTLRYSPYTVFGIDKDRDGNLWLGTGSAGAFRYDGESFLWIGEKELSTLPDGRVPGVRSMLHDQDGNMWLSNFLSKYRINESLENGYEKLKAVDANDPVLGDKLPYFNSGLVAQNGDLWMTTYGGGVWTYDGETLTNTQVWNATGEVLLLSIFEDREGVIWLGTHNDGIYKQTETGFEKFVPEL